MSGHDSLLWFPDIFKRRAGAELSVRTRPGACLAAMEVSRKDALVRTLNGPWPADWWVRLVVS